MVVEAWQSLSVLIVGCGSIGKRHARNLAKLGIGDIRVCDPVASQMEGLCAETPSSQPYPSFEAGLAARPDCVWIMTPPRLHIPMALRALMAGAHVFCEKPLCDSLDGVDELQRALAGSDRKMMVGLCFRFHEGLQQAKRMLDAGQIGRLVSVRALMGEPINESRPDYKQVWTPEAIRWGAFDLTHEIDLAIWFAGQPLRRVESVHGSFSDIGLQTPDVAEVVMEFEDRCCASVHLDFFQSPRRRQLELIGTNGVITIEFAAWDACTLAVWSRSSPQWQQQTIATHRDDMFCAESREFLEAVVTDRPIACTVEEGLKSVRVVLTALGSENS